MSDHTAENDVPQRNRHDERWAGPNPATCDDRVWWEATGMCGGCGESDCHEGPCGEIGSWHTLLICDRCPHRVRQGLVRVIPPVSGAVVSGVRVGTRLEQLETLRARLDHEIASERRRVLLAQPSSPHTVPVPGPRPDPMKAALAKANTTTRDVRAWAIREGLMSPTQRHGRIGLEIIDRYREAMS